MRFRKKSSKHCVSWRVGRRFTVECLEDRRLLSAVGAFERLDARVGADMLTYVYADALAGSHLVQPENELASDGVLHRDAAVASQDYLSASAVGVSHVMASVGTPIGNTTSVPVISHAATQQGIASDGYDSWALAGFSAGGGASTASFTDTLWEYQPPVNDPPSDLLFYGSVYLTDVGVGSASGDSANWIRSTGSRYTGLGWSSVTIQVGGITVLQLNKAAYSSGYSLPDSADTGDAIVWGFTTNEDWEQIPIDYEGKGINLLVNCLVPIANDLTTDVQVIVDMESGAGAGAHQQDEFGPGPESQVNFAQSASSWFFVVADGTPVPPPGVFPMPSGDDSDVFLELVEDTDGWATGEGEARGELFVDALIAASQNQGFVVTTDADENDFDYSANDLSLREALVLAASNPGEDVITFAPWVQYITLDGTALSITSDVIITGPGADKLTIDANGLSRVFSVNSGVEATISGLTITGGLSTGGGGGVYNNGDLTLLDVDVIGNQTNTYGGGVYVSGTGTLVVDGSTFDDNHAVGTTGNAGHGAIGGNFKAGLSLQISNSTFSNNSGSSVSAASSGGAIGVYGLDPTTAFEISNSTFSGNSAGGGGALQLNSASGMTGSIVNSTIAYNSATAGAGGGVSNVNATITLHNTILAANTATNTTYHDAAGASLSGGGTSSHNIIGQIGGSGLTNGVNGNKVGTLTVRIDPLLAPLGDYGGRTKTHALLVGSPALDAGKGSLTDLYDQRGYTREVDLPTSNGIDGYRDIGAYEAGEGTTLIVRSDGDRNDSIGLKATVDSLRLREALALSAALAGSEEIRFDASLYENGPATIQLSYDGPDSGSAPDYLNLHGDVSIIGPGADKLILDGNNQTRIFFANFQLEDKVLLEGLTITGGNAVGEHGGGALFMGGDVTFRKLRIVGNTATYGGGGVFSEDVYRLRISDSEISDNAVGTNGLGGGIADYRNGLDDAPGLEIINSTISNNSVAGSMGYGGGIYLFRDDDGSSVLLPIVNSTIAFNSASLGGGIYMETITGPDFLEIHNSIVADNVNLLDAPDDIRGLGLDVALGTHNLIGLGGSGGLADNVSGNIVLNGLETSGLMPLDYYGAATRTHALKYDSQAIDAGDDAIAAYWDLDFDQRGLDRISDVDWDLDSVAHVDIGAVELAISEYYS